MAVLERQLNRFRRGFKTGSFKKSGIDVERVQAIAESLPRGLQILILKVDDVRLRYGGQGIAESLLAGLKNLNEQMCGIRKQNAEAIARLLPAGVQRVNLWHARSHNVHVLSLPEPIHAQYIMQEFKAVKLTQYDNNLLVERSMHPVPLP